jgi:Na+/melibiose symporter-like transporter
MAFMPNLWSTVGLVFAFYAAYYLYEPPYRGLYPDVLPQSYYGRAQGAQHVMRGLAIGLALIGGNELFKIWKPSPFIAAALITSAACGAVIIYVDEPAHGPQDRVFMGVRAYLSTGWCILREEPEVRRFLVANTMWEGTFAAMRTFVYLYITRGLHQPRSVVTAVLAAVAVGYVLAALVAGRLGDRFGLARVIFAASFVYAGGLCVAGFARTWHDYYYGLIFPVALAAGTVMTLAWGLLFKLTPPRHRGAISGLALGTKGVGLVFALIAGVVIDQAAPYLRSTDGYQALWPLCAVPILISIPLVGSLLRAEPSGKPAPQVG